MGFFSKIFRRKNKQNEARLKILRKRLEDEIHIDVGVHKDSIPYPDGTPTGLVAAANEFGTSRIPERSFLRSTLSENEGKYSALMEKAVKAVADGKLTLERAANLIGLEMVGDVQEKITTLSTPPNAPSTIKKKGFNNPLIETGHLRTQISHKLRKSEGA